MEPQLRLGRILLRPAIPGVFGLGFPVYKTPVVHAYLMLFGNGQKSFKGTAIGPGHVFSAEDGTLVALKPLDAFFKFLGTIVIVKADDVGLFQSQAVDGLHGIVIAPVSDPDSGGEGLGGIDRAGPDKALFQKWVYQV